MEGLVWVHQNLHGSNVINQLVKFITLLGDGGIIWITIAVCLLFFKKTRMSAIVMLVSLAVGFVFNDFVLKNIFNRARPFEECTIFAEFIKSIGMELPSGNSFPSGHAYSSFNCALVLALFNKKAAKITISLATLIALSRVFLCVHYPTDVLVGAILGILTAIVSYSIYKLVLRKLKSRDRQKIRTINNV